MQRKFEKEQSTSRWVIGVCIGMLFLAACTVGPNYHKPKITVPEQWSEPLAGGETNGEARVGAWWKTFSDPQLDSLIERASGANLQLKAAQARVLEARALRSATASERWPTVDASGSFTRNRMSGHSFLPLPPNTPLIYNLYQAGFDASWEIDIFGRTRRAVEAANADVAAAEFSQRDVLVTLTGEMARNYFELRGLQQRLAITRENVAAQKNSLELTQERFRVGLSSELDVKQASALLATTEASIPALETAIQDSIHRLAVLSGKPPGALSGELTTPNRIPSPPPMVPVGLPSDLLLRRPDIQQAERQLAAATARIGVAKADLFPRFSLTGNGGFESVNASDWFVPESRFWTFGPTVTWRIFDAGRIRANIRVQNAREQQALAAYEQTVLNAFEDVENALVAYAKEQIRYRSLETSVASERGAVALSEDLYRNGLADFIRVLDSQRSLYQAEDALVQSQKNISESLVALYKALGGGWEANTTTPQ